MMWRCLRLKKYLSVVLTAIGALSTPGLHASDCSTAAFTTAENLRMPAPTITGNTRADQHIRKLAENRGYRQHQLLSDRQLLDPDHSLHHCAARDLNRLISRARENRLPLTIISGFRSILRQRQIFLAKMARLEIPVEDIPSGRFDRQLDSILKFSSIPGYSRHHTGFAMDLQLPGGNLNTFRNSTSYHWLARDNFKIARQFGFIPSYPEGIRLQGPDPEPWEFIWVGRRAANDPDYVSGFSGNNLADAALRVVRHLASDRYPVLADKNRIHPDIQTLPGG